MPVPVEPSPPAEPPVPVPEPLPDDTPGWACPSPAGPAATAPPPGPAGPADRLAALDARKTWCHSSENPGGPGGCALSIGPGPGRSSSSQIIARIPRAVKEREPASRDRAVPRLCGPFQSLDPGPIRAAGCQNGRWVRSVPAMNPVGFTRPTHGGWVRSAPTTLAWVRSAEDSRGSLASFRRPLRQSAPKRPGGRGGLGSVRTSSLHKDFPSVGFLGFARRNGPGPPVGLL